MVATLFACSNSRDAQCILHHPGSQLVVQAEISTVRLPETTCIVVALTPVDVADVVAATLQLLLSLALHILDLALGLPRAPPQAALPIILPECHNTQGSRATGACTQGCQGAAAAVVASHSLRLVWVCGNSTGASEDFSDVGCCNGVWVVAMGKEQPGRFVMPSAWLHVTSTSK